MRLLLLIPTAVGLALIVGAGSTALHVAAIVAVLVVIVAMFAVARPQRPPRPVRRYRRPDFEGWPTLPLIEGEWYDVPLLGDGSEP